MRHSLKSTLELARQVVRDLERLSSRRPLDQAVLDELAADELNTTQLALRVRRRRSDVLAMLRAFEKAGQIRRVGNRWTLEH